MVQKNKKKIFTRQTSIQYTFRFEQKSNCCLQKFFLSKNMIEVRCGARFNNNQPKKKKDAKGKNKIVYQTKSTTNGVLLKLFTVFSFSSYFESVEYFLCVVCVVFFFSYFFLFIYWFFVMNEIKSISIPSRIRKAKDDL